MAVFIELPLLQLALEEVYGADAALARLRDLSAFTDDVLDSLMERLREELLLRQASPLFVQGVSVPLTPATTVRPLIRLVNVSLA